MDTIDLGANPRARLHRWRFLVYYPVIVTRNIAAIYLHQTLPY